MTSSGLPAPSGGEFPTVFGRGLVGELPNFVHRPYLVVTMEDLWPKFEASLGDGLAMVHVVRTLDLDQLEREAAALNRSGVSDVLCYHTAHFDWKLARDLGREEPRWPYDERLVAAARVRLDAVLARQDDIREVNEEGIRGLVLAHRWGGATFHDSGWNPRHIEGVDHFLFYNLERLTGRHFIHGQPVGLGIYVGSVLQDNHPEAMLAALHRAGVDIRPEAMGVGWDDVAEAVRTLPAYVREADLWFTVVDARPVPGDLVDRVRERVEARYGRWEPAP